MNEIKKVLVCDDDEDVLSMITVVLTGIGWQIYPTTDCSEIIEKACEISPAVILMDINFSNRNSNRINSPLKGNTNLQSTKVEQIFKEHLDRSGVKITQALKLNRQTKHIPVVLFSARDDIANLAEEAGTNLYLKKPFAIDNLENVIAQAYHEFTHVAR
jgi:CheY-like chemotaxis protein